MCHLRYNSAVKTDKKTTSDQQNARKKRIFGQQ